MWEQLKRGSEIQWYYQSIITSVIHILDHISVSPSEELTGAVVRHESHIFKFKTLNWQIIGFMQPENLLSQKVHSFLNSCNIFVLNNPREILKFSRVEIFVLKCSTSVDSFLWVRSGLRWLDWMECMIWHDTIDIPHKIKHTLTQL